MVDWVPVLGGRSRLVEGVAYGLTLWTRTLLHRPDTRARPKYVVEQPTKPYSLTPFLPTRHHPEQNEGEGGVEIVYAPESIPRSKRYSHPLHFSCLPLACSEGEGPHPPGLNPAPPPSPEPEPAPMLGGREGLFLGGVEGSPPAGAPPTRPISPSDADLCSTNASSVLERRGEPLYLLTTELHVRAWIVW